MKKFRVRLSHVDERLINGNKKKWMTCEVSVSSLVEGRRKLGDDLFAVNVRKYLSSSKPTSQERKKPVFKGIMDSMGYLRDNPEMNYMFTLKNNGCTIMCDTIEKISDDIYEITLTGDYQGIGNGQQTTCISDWIDSNKPIDKDITITCKILIGFSEDDCRDICESNNTSNKIDKKDIKSREWVRICNELKSLGISFNYKKEKDGDYDINIFEEGYYNIIASYFTNKPWVTGQNVTDILNIHDISGKDMIELDRIKKDLDNWFLHHKESIDRYDNIMDTTRLGYMKNIIISLYTDEKINRYVKTYVKKYGFRKYVELVFKVIVNKIDRYESKKVSSKYFTNKTIYESLIDSVELRIMKETELKMELV